MQETRLTAELDDDVVLAAVEVSRMNVLENLKHGVAERETVAIIAVFQRDCCVEACFTEVDFAIFCFEADFGDGFSFFVG